MANVKITDLTAIAGVDLATNDVLPIVDINVDQTKKVAISDLTIGISDANDFVTYTQLNANINVVQDNVEARHTQLDSNINIVQDNVVSNFIQLDSNINVVQDNVLANYFQLDANINVVQANVTANFTQLDANISVVQDNVAAAEANVGLVRSNIDSFASTSNSNAAALAAGIAGTSVDLTVAADSGTNDVVVVGTDTFTFAGGTGLTSTVSDNQIQFDLDATAVTAGVYGGKIGTVSNVPVLTIDAQGRITAASNSEVAVDLSTLEGNVNTVSSNVSALDVQVNANLDTVQDNVTANFNQLDANISVVQDNVTSNFNQLDANIDVVQTNVASITDGTTAFTGEVTMNDDLIITGNLVVNGAQVDLGVTTATISNNLIELSAELGPTDSPTTDSGLLINRGNEGNVFIGKSVAEDGVIFAHTLSADSNVTIAIDEFMDAHANAFHAAADASLARVHFGLRASEDTGIVIDDTGANINFAIDGAYKANVHYDGTLNSQNAVIAPAIYSGEVELRANDYATYTTLDTRIDTVSSNADAIESRRTANIAGAISTVLTTDLTASRALIAGTGGKIEVSDITSTELGHLDGIDQNINSNLVALAAGIAATASGSFPDGDYGLLDSANTSTDSFGVAIADLTTFDMKNDPTGSLSTEDLGVLT